MAAQPVSSEPSDPLVGHYDSPDAVYDLQYGGVAEASGAHLGNKLEYPRDLQSGSGLADGRSMPVEALICLLVIDVHHILAVGECLIPEDPVCVVRSVEIV